MNVIKISFDVITVGKSKNDNKILEDILAILSNNPSIDNISVKKNNKVDNTSDIEEYEDEEYSTELVLKDDNNTNEVSIIDETDDANILKDISISELNLSTRAYNVLNKNYKNLYELSHITIEDLLETRELGSITIKEIVDKLYDNGVYIEHNTLKNIKTGKVRYTSKYDNTVYKIWKLI